MDRLRNHWKWLLRQPAFHRAPFRVLLRLHLGWRLLRFRLRGRPWEVTFPTFNIRMVVPPPQRRSFARLLYALQEDYEPELRYLWGLLRPGNVVVDAGAAFGIYTLVAARRVGPSGCVIAFEPTTETYSFLIRNIELNGFHWVRAFQWALGASEGEALLYHSPYDLAQSSLAPPDRRISPASHELVRVRTLDNVLDELGFHSRLDVLKVDVEGAEELVLRGAERHITTCRPIIVFEINSSGVQRLGLDPEGCWKFLSMRGYRFFYIGLSGELHPLSNLSYPPALRNAIAVPESGK